MPSFFRSERMHLYTVVLHPETAFDCIVELGYVGGAQLVNVYDGNVVTNNKYNTELERCADLLRIVQFLQDECDDFGLRIFNYADVDRTEIPRENDLQSIEKTLKPMEQELIQVCEHCNDLKKRKLQLIEHRLVLLKTQNFLTGALNTEVQITSYDSMMQDLLYDTLQVGERERMDRNSLKILAGSIPVKRFAAFEIMVWRISRGIAYVKHVQFQMPEEWKLKNCENHNKIAFMICFVGDELEKKLLKVTQGFQVTLFACPGTQVERKIVLYNIRKEMEDLEDVLQKSLDHKKRILLATVTELQIWYSKLRKMSDVYFVLNHLGRVRELRRLNQKYLQVDCWIPDQEVKAVRAGLNRGAFRAAEFDPTQVFPPIIYERSYSEKIKPPTLFRTNKFTRGFQNLVDSYGIASYRELNPAPYTIVTFPFLFAVMFGDTVHGLILALFAWLLVYREKHFQREQQEATKANEIFDIIFAGRYILLLMGIFSIYTGLIYNDHLSKPLNIFGTSWRVNFTVSSLEGKKFVDLDPAREDNFLGVPYLVGIDPIWTGAAENYIIIGNSLKMKISIILGVFHMMFGIVLSAFNALHHKSKIDFYLVFLPQIIFFASLFLYLVCLIFLKWLTYGGSFQGEKSIACAPSILITFINMVLLKGAAEVPKGCTPWMFPGQLILERILLVLALASIPVLLCGKPIHFILQHRLMHKTEDPERKDQIRRATLESMRKSLIYSVDELPAFRDSDEDQQLSEVWIHSGIHTIECVLGSVSHTASYLRLWALSLAHAQLSHVLWKMVLSIGLSGDKSYYNSIIIYVTFALFAVLTVSILVVMEGLSAFLHTLRLHWVEFQSKFYKGTGEVFQPFQFKPSKKMVAEPKREAKEDCNHLA